MHRDCVPRHVLQKLMHHVTVQEQAISYHEKQALLLKSALANAPLLAHPSPSAEIALTTNAWDVALGAVLEQRVSGIWQPLAFFSHTLRDAERKYSVF